VPLPSPFRSFLPARNTNAAIVRALLVIDRAT